MPKHPTRSGSICSLFACLGLLAFCFAAASKPLAPESSAASSEEVRRFGQQFADTNHIDALSVSIVRRNHVQILNFRPGEAPRHSNLAAELLGYILARRYGQSYATLVQSKIQRPLGMANGASADDPKLVVQGYDAHRVPMPMTSQRAVLAAGGIRFSPQDMAKFLEAELARTNPAIRMSQRIAWGSVDTGAVGFTWNISRNVEGALKLNMSGGTSGSASYVEIYPERGYGIVLLANRSGETEALLYGLADTLFATNEGTPALDALKNVLEQSRYAHVDRTVRRVRKRFPNLTLSQAFVNNWGGGLLGSNPKAALALFAYNAHRWPQSSDAYDSLGDGYAANGKRQAAMLAYRRALVLNSENKEAADSLAHLLRVSSTK